MSRPRVPNSEAMWSTSSSRRSSSTPMTAAIASRVTSSCVGPMPPQTTTASAFSSISRIAATIRGRLSPTLRCSIVSRPTAASCSPIHEEFVSTIWPSNSSVPIARTSTRTRALPPAAAHDVDARDDREHDRDPEDRELHLRHVLDGREEVRADRQHLEDGLPLAELARGQRDATATCGRAVDRHEDLTCGDQRDREPPDRTAHDQNEEASDRQDLAGGRVEERPGPRGAVPPRQPAVHAVGTREHEPERDGQPSGAEPLDEDQRRH